MLDKFGFKDPAAVMMSIGVEKEDEETNLLPSVDSGSIQRSTVQTFQSLVGSLLWIARCTRSDIAVAAHKVTWNFHANEADWRLATKYLKGTKGLKFTNDGMLIETLSDANYAADRINRNSISGGVMMVIGMVVEWLCQKQKFVALSTMEAEFVAASQTAAEMMGIIKLLQEIGVSIQHNYILHVDK
ncbi:unnamed protein product [Peronospora effusa]|nr:unnamed protein product [Peronospora effusa]